MTSPDVTAAGSVEASDTAASNAQNVVIHPGSVCTARVTHTDP